MILLKLYVEFFKIGVVAFGGGYAILPLINSSIVQQQGWISVAEMTDLVSISNMTPGPIGLNAATFVGTKIAGMPGSVAATAGIVTPSAIIMLTLGYLLFSSGRKMAFLDKMLVTLRPTVVGLIAIAAIDMVQASLFGSEGFKVLGYISGVELITFIVGLVLYSKKVDMIRIIAVGAVMGIGLSYIL